MTHQRLLARYVAAYNAHDAVAVRACFSTDVRSAQNGKPGRQGIDGFMTILGAQWAGCPDSTSEVPDAIVAGDPVVFEWGWTGHHGGPLELDDSRIVTPTGRLVQQMGVDLLAIVGDRNTEVLGYWDNLTELRQLRLG